MPLVFDTNIYVSAFQFGGKPLELVQMALDGEVEVAISQPIIDETRRVLRDKFGFRRQELDRVQAIMDLCTKRVETTQRLSVVEDGPDDHRIIECAVAAGAEAIITGDKHLLRIGSYQGIRIMRVGEFLGRKRGK